MAIEARESFIDQLVKQMSGTLTVDQSKKLVETCNSILDRFDISSRGIQDGPDDLLKCYISALSVECKSEKTLQRYEYIIRKLMEFVKVPTRQVTVYHLRAYLQHEKERGICDNTLEGCRAIFSAYFNWLQRESLIEKNPTANLGTVKVAKKEKATYSEIDIEKLVRGCKTVRDRAIIHFLASTGCRISEMTGLDRDAIRFDSLECVVHGKGNKERTVYLSEVAGMIISEYLKSRKDDNPALFVGKFRERMTPGGVRSMLKVLAKQTGVDHVHPHKFRRTLATGLTRHGMPIQEVARILGHEKIDTTMRYVVLNKDDIKTSYRRYA